MTAKRLHLDRLPLGLETRPIARTETGPLAAAMRVPESVVSNRLGAGKLCFVALAGGSIASYAWISLDWEAVPECGTRVTLREDEAYVWDCHSLPEFRGLGLMPAVLSNALDTLSDLARQRAWAVIADDNHPSQRAFAKVGFAPVVQVRYTRLLSFAHTEICRSPHTPTEIVEHALRILSQSP